MRKFKKFFTFVFSTVLAASSVLSTSSMAVTPADVEAKDPNGDGVITMADVAFMYQILGGKYAPSDLTRFDIDDNDVVSDVDAIYTQMYTAGMLSNSVSSTPEDENSSIMSVAETSSTSRNYRVYNAQTGAYLRNYSLEVENFDSTYNARQIIGDNNQETDWSNRGVAKIICGNIFGTGFVVGKHTIATAAHVVLDTKTNNAYSITDILLFDENGTDYSFTPVEYHLPLLYWYETNYTHINDYALITVEEDLSDYMSFNLGMITDNAVTNNLPITTVGFPSHYLNSIINNGVDHQEMLSSGTLTAGYHYNLNNTAICHTADTYGGNSGGPIYTIESVNGKTYHTVIGINVAEPKSYSTYNIGVRFTPHVLKFYKGNSNIQY